MTRRTRMLAAAVVLAAVTVAGGAVAVSAGPDAASAAEEPPPNTANVERGRLSATVSEHGVLIYRARADGAPYTVINPASGTYTELPEAGATVDCGAALYRVDDAPVLLLCGRVPAYRDLSAGDKGRDVRQLNENLHRFGYDADAGVKVDPEADAFTSQTRQALEELQRDAGADVTGTLDADAVVFLPGAVRIGGVTAQLGGTARPGEDVAHATSDTLEVQVDLDPSQRDDVKAGDRARITLPGNTSVTGKVDRLASVAHVPDDQDDGRGVTFPAFVSLDDPEAARGFDEAPVRVDITTAGIDDALSVPVTALVGKSGGGFAVEVVRDGGRRELVAVEPGLFDTAGGRVQVEGELGEGDRVVVPSS